MSVPKHVREKVLEVCGQRHRDVTWSDGWTDLLYIDITVVWTHADVSLFLTHKHALLLQWMYLHSAGSVHISLRLSISGRALSFKSPLCPVHRTEPNRVGLSPGVRVQLRKRKWSSASETVSMWLKCPDNERQIGPLCGWRQDTSRDWDAVSHIQKQEWRKEWHSPSAKHKNTSGPTAPPPAGRPHHDRLRRDGNVPLGVSLRANLRVSQGRF